jgi:hypothetical protein
LQHQAADHRAGNAAEPPNRQREAETRAANMNGVEPSHQNIGENLGADGARTRKGDEGIKKRTLVHRQGEDRGGADGKQDRHDHLDVALIRKPPADENADRSPDIEHDGKAERRTDVITHLVHDGGQPVDHAEGEKQRAEVDAPGIQRREQPAFREQRADAALLNFRMRHDALQTVAVANAVSLHLPALACQPFGRFRQEPHEDRQKNKRQAADQHQGPPAIGLQKKDAHDAGNDAADKITEERQGIGLRSAMRRRKFQHQRGDSRQQRAKPETGEEARDFEGEKIRRHGRGDHHRRKAGEAEKNHFAAADAVGHGAGK